jgi:hypothetical protein
MIHNCEFDRFAGTLLDNVKCNKAISRRAVAIVDARDRR